jgi:hypothetical protein
VTAALIFGLAIHGFTVPGHYDTDLVTALEAIPGALIGIAAVYFYGAGPGNERLVVGEAGTRNAADSSRHRSTRWPSK